MPFVLFNKTWYCTAIDPLPRDKQVVMLCTSGKITPASFNASLNCFFIEAKAKEQVIDPKKQLLYWAEHFD